MNFLSWPGLSFSGMQMLADCNRGRAFLLARYARVCLKQKVFYKKSAGILNTSLQLHRLHVLPGILQISIYEKHFQSGSLNLLVCTISPVPFLIHCINRNFGTCTTL